MGKKYQYGFSAGKVVLLYFCCILFLCGCGKKDTIEHLSGESLELNLEDENDGTGKKQEVKEKKTDFQPKSDEEKIFVYVSGHVNAPGVYQLKSGARIGDAIALAGGLSESAALFSVNQAKPVEDGMQIHIPSEASLYSHNQSGENEEGIFDATVEGADIENEKRLSINTATKEELMSLPGIGASKAESILKYRKEHGGFSSIEDLKKIEGIKDGVFQKIKDEIKL